MSGERLDVLGLNSNPEIGTDISPYQIAEKEYILASSSVDEQIAIIKESVGVIIDPNQRKILNKVIKELQTNRIKELRAISEMNMALISNKNDEYLNYIKIFRKTNIGMGLADNNSKSFVLLNNALCKILEINANDYIGIDYPSFWDQFVTDKEAFNKLKKEFINNGEINGGILPIITPKGTHKWIRIYSISIEGQREVFTILDITEREKDRLGQLRAMHTFKHDIRGPIGGAERLLDVTFNGPGSTELNIEDRDRINFIQKALKKVLNAADNYLDLAKMEKGLFKPVFVKINLVHTIKDVLKSLTSGYYEDKFIFVDSEGMKYNPNEDIIIDGEDTYLNLMLFNLLKNALEGYINKEDLVKISFQDYEDYILITVNNKKEIPEGIKKNVFRKQFVETSKPDGNGIGTYSMKLIIDMHNGKINFESNKKDGTTMFIWLPKIQKNKPVETK